MNYEIIAIIIGPLIAVFTVYLEYKKDLKIKLEDRKQFWLKKHYIYIQENIKKVINNIQIKNNMIYNGAVEISINSASKQGMYQMTIINKLEPLANGDINEHLKSYEFYENLMDLYNGVEKYKTNLQNLHAEFCRFIQITVDKHFKKTIKQKVYNLYTIEIYDAEPMFKTLVYSVFTKNNHKIDEESDQSFRLEYSNGGANTPIFFSKSSKKADKFANCVMPDIISHFNDKLMCLGEKSTEIGDALENIVPKILKITGDYNSGIPFKGECKNCKSIKEIKKLDGLMPPN